MDGICRAFGAGVPIKLAGRMVVLPPMWLVDFGVCEQLLLTRREMKTGHFVVAANMPTTMREEVISRFWFELRESSKIPEDDLLKWLATKEGLVFSLWIVLQRVDSRFWSFERIEKAIAKLNPIQVQALIDLRDQASSTDMMALSDWPREMVLQEKPKDRPGRKPAKALPDKKKKKVSWRRVFRSMIDSGIQPGDAGRMTIHQAHSLSVEIEQLGGTTKMSVADFKAMNERKKKDATK